MPVNLKLPRMKNKNLCATILFVAIIAINISCSKSSTDNGGGAVTPSASVSIVGPMSFSPANLSVKVGTVVKWTNTDVTNHTVTSDNGITFNSGNIAPNSIFSYTTTITGTFPYHCTIHGIAMSGTLTVNP